MLSYKPMRLSLQTFILPAKRHARESPESWWWMPFCALTPRPGSPMNPTSAMSRNCLPNVSGPVIFA